MRVFDPKPRDGDMKPPLTHEELWARQERFYADGRLKIEREAPAGVRSRLVFVQCGRGFDAPWLSEPRSYDVLLNGYEEGDANPRADGVVFQAGTKTTAIRRLLAERPDCLLRYEAVLFLDDDVEIGAGRHRRAVRRDGGGGARPRPAGADRRLRVRVALPQAARGAEPSLPGVDGRDHGAPHDAPRAGGRRLRPSPRPSAAGGPISCSARRCAAHSGRASVGVIGSVAVRHAPQGRSFRRRLLRLSAPLRDRSGARGQPCRRRFRGRALPAAAGARGAGTDLRPRTSKARTVRALRAEDDLARRRRSGGLSATAPAGPAPSHRDPRLAPSQPSLNPQ